MERKFRHRCTRREDNGTQKPPESQGERTQEKKPRPHHGPPASRTVKEYISVLKPPRLWPPGNRHRCSCASLPWSRSACSWACLPSQTVNSQKALDGSDLSIPQSPGPTAPWRLRQYSVPGPSPSGTNRSLVHWLFKPSHAGKRESDSTHPPPTPTLPPSPPDLWFHPQQP